MYIYCSHCCNIVLLQTENKSIGRIWQGKHPLPSEVNLVRFVGGLGVAAKERWRGFLTNAEEKADTKQVLSALQAVRPPPVDRVRGLALFGISETEARALGRECREQAARRASADDEALLGEAQGVG